MRKSIAVWIFLSVAIGLVNLFSPFQMNKLLLYLLDFETSLSDFKNLYPRFYLPLFLLFRSLPLLVIGVSLLLLYKNKKRIIESFLQAKSKDSINALGRYFLTRLIVVLIIFLCFYFLSKIGVGNVDNLHRYQLNLSRGFVLLFALMVITTFYKYSQLIKSTIHNFLFTPTSPYGLALFRIIFFLFLAGFYSAFKQTRAFRMELESAPLPYMGWFIEEFQLSTAQYELFCVFGIITAFFLTFGLFTRSMLIINAILIFIIVATPNFYGKLSHQQIYIWIAWILVWTPCADVWSIDAWINKRKGKVQNIAPKSDYAFPLKLIWLHIGIIYFFSGVYKLWNAGFDWALSGSMIYQLQEEWVQHYDQVPFIRFDHYPILLHVSGLGIILFELLFVFMLFHFVARRFAILGGLFMHNMAGYLMKIRFLHLQMMYVSFVNWDWLLLRLIEFERKIFKNKLFSNDSEINGLEHYLTDLEQNKPAPAPLQYGKTIIYIGVTIFSLNFLCGFFAIHSYPFSAYPSYSDIAPPEIDILHFEGVTANATEVDVLTEAQKSGFLREDYTIFEENIIASWKSGKNIESQVLNYWQIWRKNVPKLKEVKYLKIYYHRTPVQPEKRDQYLVNELILELEL